jgi:ATP-dependent DNA helicase RecG
MLPDYAAQTLKTSLGRGTVTVKVTEKVIDKVTDKEQLVLGLLLEDSRCTYPELAARLSVSRKTIGERIRSLKEKGIIKREGSDRQGHWAIIGLNPEE